MTKINLIHTPCKNCIFAIYEGKTQTGCETKSLDLFKKNQVEILDVFDDDTEFFVINGKKCLSYRDKTWLENKSVQLAEAVNLVNEENKIKYISVIVLESDTTLDAIKSVIESQIAQHIPPKGFMIIREMYKQYTLDIKQLSDYLSKLKTTWRMQNFVDQEMTFNDRLRSIVKSGPIDRYYYLIYPSKYIHLDFAQTIDNYIANGKTFGCINIHGNLFFSYLAYQYAKNITNIDILNDTQGQIEYEKIN